MIVPKLGQVWEISWKGKTWRANVTHIENGQATMLYEHAPEHITASFQDLATMKGIYRLVQDV